MYGYEIFHEDILNKLIGNVRRGTYSCAYVFEGPAGLHKKEAALLFAKALVCDTPEIAPCCECPSCTEAQSSNHPDIITVERPTDKATIGVDTIRDMITECYIKPFSQRHKIFIINEGDLLTAQAQNAFLKILEEPPEYAVFIIVCTSALALLETVRSRSLVITFPPTDDSVLRRYIETKYPDETRTDFLVSYCEGIPTAADKIISRSDFEQTREEVLDLVPKILSQNKTDSFAVSKYFDDNKAAAPELCNILLTYLRDALAVCMGRPMNIINKDKTDKLQLLAQTYPPELIVKAVDEVILAKHMLERYVKASAAILHAALRVSPSQYSENYK